MLDGGAQREVALGIDLAFHRKADAVDCAAHVTGDSAVFRNGDIPLPLVLTADLTAVRTGELGDSLLQILIILLLPIILLIIRGTAGRTAGTPGGQRQTEATTDGQSS